jgi:hypothetical protein
LTKLANETDSISGDAFLRRYLSYDVSVGALENMESGSYDAQDEAKQFLLLVLQAAYTCLAGNHVATHRILEFVHLLKASISTMPISFPLESRWWALRRALYEEAVLPAQIREYT